MFIYKICDASLWNTAVEAGEFKGAEIDLIDGYIHFSTAEQMRETAAKHFIGREGLVIVAVDADALGEEIKWEPSRGGALFPHLYRVLRMEDVAWSCELDLTDEGTPIIPPLS